MTGTADAPRTAVPPGRPAPPLWLLVLFTFSATVAMHIFTPALPAAGRSFEASAAAMQLTVAVYVFGLAVGQPIYGPLADGFGRRPALMAGLALFTLGGLLALWAPTLKLLVAARFVQALGGCAGLVLGRVMVRDTSEAAQAVRRLSLLALAMTLAPGLAPLLGQTVASLVGWRWIFALLAGLGVLNLLLGWRILPETGRPTGHVSVATLRRDYGLLLRSPVFLGFVIGGGFATTAIYAFLAAAPFIFVDGLHRPPHEVGLFLGLTMVGFALGSVVGARLAGRLGVERLLLRGNQVLLVSAAVLLVAAASGWLNWQVALGSMMLYAVGGGMTGPAALTKSMSIDPRLVGAGAGLYGAMQMVAGSVCTSLAAIGPDPAVSVAVVLLLAALFSRVMFRVAGRADAAHAGAPQNDAPNR